MYCKKGGGGAQNYKDFTGEVLWCSYECNRVTRWDGNRDRERGIVGSVNSRERESGYAEDGRDG